MLPATSIATPSAVTRGLVGVSRARAAAASASGRALGVADDRLGPRVDQQRPGVAVHQQRGAVGDAPARRGPRPATAGMPSARAMIEAWEVGPPAAVAMPVTRAGSMPATSAAPSSEATSTPSGAARRPPAPRMRRHAAPHLEHVGAALAHVGVVERRVGVGRRPRRVAPRPRRRGPGGDRRPRPAPTMPASSSSSTWASRMPRAPGSADAATASRSARAAARAAASAARSGPAGRPRARRRRASAAAPTHVRRAQRRRPGAAATPVSASPALGGGPRRPPPAAPGPAARAGAGPPSSSATAARTAASAASASAPRASMRTRLPWRAPSAISAVRLRADAGPGARSGGCSGAPRRRGRRRRAPPRRPAARAGRAAPATTASAERQPPSSSAGAGAAAAAGAVPRWAALPASPSAGLGRDLLQAAPGARPPRPRPPPPRPAAPRTAATRARVSSGSRSSAVSALRTAEPRSISTSAAVLADPLDRLHHPHRVGAQRVAGLVEPARGARSRPRRPPISRASSTTPSASRALCETMTSPTIGRGRPRHPSPYARCSISTGCTDGRSVAVGDLPAAGLRVAHRQLRAGVARPGRTASAPTSMAMSYFSRLQPVGAGDAAADRVHLASPAGRG